MDDEDREEISATISIAAYVQANQARYGETSNDLGDHRTLEPTFGCQTKPDLYSFGAQTRPTVVQTAAVDNQVNMATENKNNLYMNVPKEETYCNIKLDSLQKLKDSTRKLICLLEDIQSKTHSNNTIFNDIHKSDKDTKSFQLNKDFQVSQISDLIEVSALKQLEAQTKYLDAIYIQDEEDDCSVFKRLTRKCHCLNHKQYNDFVIHFNEDTKFATSTLGELIKNIRILKKFLYMGGEYTKNALLFLNEGLSEKSSHAEKVDIIQACSHADVCNIFDDNSIAIVCILWPFRFDSYGNSMTQELAAGLLHKLSAIEEGRRYLNFSSKISNDIKKILRLKSSVLEFDTLEALNSTLCLLNPPMTQHINITYYCKAEEGMGNRTLIALARYSMYMTLEEIFAHLDLLLHISKHESGRKEITQYLPKMLCLFKTLLVEYDDSDMNLIITNILNNIVAKTAEIDDRNDMLKTVTVAEVTTEPINVKHVLNQVPSLKKKVKKSLKSQLGLASNKNNKSKRKNEFSEFSQSVKRSGIIWIKKGR